MNHNDLLNSPRLAHKALTDELQCIQEILDQINASLKSHYWYSKPSISTIYAEYEADKWNMTAVSAIK